MTLISYDPLIDHVIWVILKSFTYNYMSAILLSIK